MPANISILPAELSDVPAFVQLSVEANWTDPLHEASAVRPTDPEEQARLFDHRVRLGTERQALPNRHYFKAVDEDTGRIVAMTGWHGPAPKMQEKYAGKPKFLSGQMFEEVKTKLGNAFEEVKRSEPDGWEDEVWNLQSLSVHPNYHRQGIATRMLQDGLARLVDEDRADCYVESTPAGLKVYERFGFEKRTTASFLSGGYELVVMVRKARGRGPS